MTTVYHTGLHFPAWWPSMRHSFLMLDLFPENSERFGLTYSKWIGDAV
jgi:hypothetical protein